MTSTAVAEEPPRPLLTPNRVRELLARYELRPSKGLGQHYLADPNTARKVARLGGAGPGETVLEVGPGLGSLTLALREAGAAVVAVEADPRLLPALAEVLGDDPWSRSRSPTPSGPTWPRSPPRPGGWSPTCPTTSPPPWSSRSWPRPRPSTTRW